MLSYIFPVVVLEAAFHGFHDIPEQGFLSTKIESYAEIMNKQYKE